MRDRRRTPQRGLLAGLLALTTFASAAVAMTAGGSSGAPSPFTQATSAATSAAGAYPAAGGRIENDAARMDPARDVGDFRGRGGDGGSGRR